MLRKEQPNPNPQLSFSFTINFQELALEQELGRGGFGVVYKATYRHNDVAVKQLLSNDISADSAQEFETEVQFMAKLHSPNIVHFYGYSLSPNRCIVMEYMSNGSLYSVLHSNKPLEWPLRLQIATDAAKGLAFLHHENILHRDIKSLNVLLDNSYKAKLTDFGLSKVKAETKSHALATKTNSKDSVGTIQWMAPELFSRRAIFTQKSDIYSLGVTFWELASRSIPFSDALDASLIKDWVKEGDREDIPVDCPPAFGTLIQQCWDGEPSKRPDTNGVIIQLKQTLEMLAPQKISNTPSPSPSPFPIPSGPQYFSNLVSEDAPKPLVFSFQSKSSVNENIEPEPTIPEIKQTTLKSVRTFLKRVVEGEQDKAERRLKKNPELALLPSDVTDLSGRIFKGITGFQYAVWALDWHMWTMILKYLPKDQATAQIKAMDRGSWVLQHRESGDWLTRNLIDAWQTQINLLNKKQRDEAVTQWERKVGGAQYLLPVHVINEYCHPNRSFEPCPDFTESEPLPRTRKIDNEDMEAGDWFATSSYMRGKLGETFGVERAGQKEAFAVDDVGPENFIEQGHGPWRRRVSHPDLKAIQTLLATRLLQRDQLIAELTNGNRRTYK